MFRFVWDDQAVALLRRLWSENLSATEIVAQLSVGLTPGRVTRNSVLGKVHRLGLSCRVLAVRKPRQPKKLRRKTWGQQPMVAVSSLLKKSQPMPVKVVDTTEPVPSVMFCDVVAGQCKYIPGENVTYDAMCCGARTGDVLMPWCWFHARIVFQPVRSAAKR